MDQGQIDIVLDELLNLEDDIKPKLKRIEEIKTWCKEQGSFCTDYHVCSIKEHTRTAIVSLKKAVDALGKEMLESFGLIQTTEFKTVHVSKKSIF